MACCVSRSAIVHDSDRHRGPLQYFLGNRTHGGMAQSRPAMRADDDEFKVHFAGVARYCLCNMTDGNMRRVFLPALIQQ